MMDIPGCSERTNFKYIACACFMSFKYDINFYFTIGTKCTDGRYIAGVTE